MAKENLEDLSVEKLNKRKIFVSILLIILFVAAVLDVAIAVYDAIIGNGINIYLIAPAFACIAIAIPIYTGLKKVNEELAVRNEK